MAGIFAPTLQSNVTPVQSVQAPSAVGALANLTAGVAQGFFRARDEREKAERARQPTYAERKDAREAGILSDYTNELLSIQQTADAEGWSPSKRASKERSLRITYAQQGVDVTSTAFKASEEAVTGRPSEDFGRTEDDIYIESVQSREGGEGLVVSARLDLQSRGLDPNDPTNVAASLREKETKQAEVQRLTIDETLNVKQGKAIFTTALDDLVTESEQAIGALTAAGVTVPLEAIQNQYLKVKNLEQQARSFLSRNPNAPQADKDDIEKALSRAEAVFEVAGVVFEGGEFKQMGPLELKAQENVRATIRMLQNAPDAADNMIALGLTDPKLQKDPAFWLKAQSRIEALGGISDVQPDWISDNNIIVSNSLMKTYGNFIEYQTDPQRGFEKKAEGAVSLLEPEEQAKWSGMTNAQGWAALKAYTSSSQVLNQEQNLTPRQADGMFNSLVGLSLSLEQIDIQSEALSFKGLTEVPAELPRMLAKLKAVDPTRGTLAEEMLYRSIAGQKLAYDKRIASDEAAVGLTYNPKINSFSFVPDTSNASDNILQNILTKHYQGDILAAKEDNFSKITAGDLDPSSLPEELVRTVELSRNLKEATSADIQSYLVPYFRSKVPDEKLLKDNLDMRRSSVYLSKLGDTIEPEGAKEARTIAKEATEALRGKTGTDIQGRNAVTVSELQGADVLAAEANGPIAQKLGIDFAQIEIDNGLPSGFLERSAAIESSGNPKAKNPKSSAGGLFQQIDSNAKAFGVKDRFDPVQSTEGAVKFAKQNQGILREALGREPTGAELYLAHQQGPGGAKALLTRSGELALTVLKGIYKSEAKAKAAITLNGGSLSMTAGEFANIWIKKFNQGGGGQNTQTNPPSRSERPQARPESASVEPTLRPVARPANLGVDTGAPVTAPELAPEDAPQTSGSEGSQQAVQASSTPPEVQALIQAMTSRPLTEEEKAQLEQYLSQLEGA